MPVTPAAGQAMSAGDVGRFFGDSLRDFSFKKGYIYHNDNGANMWYFALWVDDLRDICVSPADAAALPAGVGCAHVSLLKTWMPDEATATAFSDSLTTQLTRLKKKISAEHFRGMGLLDEAHSTEEYALVSLLVYTPLYRTCHQLLHSAKEALKLPEGVLRGFKACFHVSFDSHDKHRGRMLVTPAASEMPSSSEDPPSPIMKFIGPLVEFHAN